MFFLDFDTNWDEASWQKHLRVLGLVNPAFWHYLKQGWVKHRNMTDNHRVASAQRESMHPKSIIIGHTTHTTHKFRIQFLKCRRWYKKPCIWWTSLYTEFSPRSLFWARLLFFINFFYWTMFSEHVKFYSLAADFWCVMRRRNPASKIMRQPTPMAAYLKIQMQVKMKM